MALRNAFEEMSTETTMKRLAMALDLLSARLSTDQGGRLRVITDATSVMAATTLYWQNQNTYAAYYSTGAPVSMDAREVQAHQSVMNFNNVRSQRWSG